MADRDIVGDTVRDVAKGLSDPFKSQREAAGRAYEGAKKTVRDTVSRVSDRAKKAMSSSKSSGRKSAR